MGGRRRLLRPRRSHSVGVAIEDADAVRFDRALLVEIGIDAPVDGHPIPGLDRIRFVVPISIVHLHGNQTLAVVQPEALEAAVHDVAGRADPAAIGSGVGTRRREDGAAGILASLLDSSAQTGRVSGHRRANRRLGAVL